MKLLRMGIRVVVISLISLMVVAIGVGRWRHEEPALTRVSERISQYHFYRPATVLDRHTVDWIDTDTGKIHNTRLTLDKELMWMSCAPWRFSDGHREAVAICRDSSAIKQAGSSQQSGMALFDVDSGAILEEFEIGSAAPAFRGAPLWNPNTSSRVFLAIGGDERIYRFDLDEQPLSPTPMSVAGQAISSGGSPEEIRDQGLPIRFRGQLTWLDPLARESRIFSSCIVNASSGKSSPALIPQWRIVLLRTDPTHRSIIAAQTLVYEDLEEASASRDETSPSVHALGNNQYLFAFMRLSRDVGWEVRVIKMILPDDGSAPRLQGRSKFICQSRAESAPAFSKDGRWLTTTSGLDDTSLVVKRFPLDDVLKELGVP